MKNKYTQVPAVAQIELTCNHMRIIIARRVDKNIFTIRLSISATLSVESLYYLYKQKKKVAFFVFARLLHIVLYYYVNIARRFFTDYIYFFFHLFYVIK